MRKGKNMPPDTDNPTVILLAKFTGSSLTKPRIPIAYNVWARFNKEKVDEAYAQDAKTLPIRQKMAEWTRVIKRLFDTLLSSECTKYVKLAQKEGEEKQKLWQERLTEPPSTDPGDQQR